MLEANASSHSRVALAWTLPVTEAPAIFQAILNRDRTPVNGRQRDLCAWRSLRSHLLRSREPLKKVSKAQPIQFDRFAFATQFGEGFHVRAFYSNGKEEE